MSLLSDHSYKYLNPAGRTMVLGSTQPPTEMSTRSISGRGGGGQCEGLTTSPPSFVDCHEIWEPQPPGTLRACPGLYRDCFTFAYNCLITDLPPLDRPLLCIPPLLVSRFLISVCLSVFRFIPGDISDKFLRLL